MTGTHAGREDARRQQVQRILLAADDDGVPGVVAAVELDDVVDAAAEQVGRLALAFVAPLGPDDHDGRHLDHHSHPAYGALRLPGARTGRQ